ncbi:hypothetical protein AAG570_012608 [Ranatra chinensis]|uniref:UBX domain-containing protein n=1 Tax=Ranatra chinensis TaxID=642074 RepID=A0ABD0YEC7_9HEMI
MDSEDSSPEEYEDASETFTVEDEMFVDEMPRRVEPLIPDDVDDEATGAVHFSDAFSRRYGDSHPEFFPGTLEDAIKEACMKPAKERKLLALYLHHDRSVLANVFCTELLCFESVLQTLAAYFVIWGWDITNDANKNKFLASVTQSLGIAVAETISSIQMDNLPALIIITRSRSNTELFTVINGNIGVSELLTLLIHAVDYYSDLQKEEMKEEEERTKRELIKIEQDQAFQQSLLLDRAKEEAKRQQEIMASKERERLAKEKQEMETKRQAERLAIQSKLPEEPEESCGSNTIKIRFRCPGQKILERRFLESQNLELLFNYLTVEGYRTDEYKVILSWPRRDVSTFTSNAAYVLLDDYYRCDMFI